MIFYTLQGPSHSLEIHDDKLLLKKRIWLRAFSWGPSKGAWELKNLSQFSITVPHYLLWGQVEWKTSDGGSGTFRFFTRPDMMRKIELYLQKRVTKNQQALLALTPTPPLAIKKLSKKARRRERNQEAAA